MAFALRQAGLRADQPAPRRNALAADGKDGALAIHLICYASHPSDAVRRYTLRKLTLGGGAGPARHLVIDYDVAPAPAPSVAGSRWQVDTFAGDLATLCRLVAQHAVTEISRIAELLQGTSGGPSERPPHAGQHGDRADLALPQAEQGSDQQLHHERSGDRP